MNKLGIKYFEEITKSAQELVDAEQRPGFNPTDFDFETTLKCSNCHTYCKEKFSCAKCKAPVYCSKKCVESNWFTSSVPGAPAHRELCKDNQRHMKRIPETEAILLQFPWGRLEKDRTFNNDIARGRFKVLGGSNFGFWSHRGGPIAHLPHEDLLRTVFPQDRVMRELFLKTFNHLDGLDLLETRHLTDKDGWKLEPELIPFHRFSSLWEPPRLVTKVQLTDWDSWYRWRRLPKASPAALLMSFPMSVYWILVEILKIAHPKKGSCGAKPTFLTVHYVGAEKELNYLLLFSELALLLPHYDIKLVMFGQAVHNLLTQAKTRPKSLAAAALEIPPRPVYTYTAPEESGSGKISIYLDTSAAWSPERLFINGGFHAFPDALVAPNAGLASYEGWRPVIVWTLAQKVPFAVTEYAEQSCETQRTIFRTLLAREARIPGSVCRGAGAPSLEQCIDALQNRARSNEDFPIILNPFQTPGQRDIPSHLPNASNGFIMTVSPYCGAQNGRDEGQGVEKLTTSIAGISIESLD